MAAYYNEIDPYAAQWLRNLIANGDIAPGDVDERSIVDVRLADLIGYAQCHFFAGIGGWSLALRIAGWSDDRPVWTGSCPCQGYSNAGAKRGQQDERHLWPFWFNLIRESKPPVIFGEQVANAITYGWLDEVFYDLESEAYACSPSVLRACSVNKDHERRRLCFVALDPQRHDYRKSREIQRTHELKTEERPEMGDAELCHSIAMGKQFRLCRDGFKRPTLPIPDVFAYGLSDQLDIEQAFGNAVVPQMCAKFIETTM